MYIYMYIMGILGSGIEENTKGPPWYPGVSKSAPFGGFTIINGLLDSLCFIPYPKFCYKYKGKRLFFI